MSVSPSLLYQAQAGGGGWLAQASEWRLTDAGRGPGLLRQGGGGWPRLGEGLVGSSKAVVACCSWNEGLADSGKEVGAG